MNLSWKRHNKFERNVVMASQLTTSNINTTTDYVGSTVRRGQYREGVFLTKVNANSTCTPKAYLDAGMVTSGLTTTTWAHYATIHSDLTTTANSAAKGVSVLPELMRVSIGHLTTSLNVRFQISACFRV